MLLRRKKVRKDANTDTCIIISRKRLREAPCNRGHSESVLGSRLCRDLWRDRPTQLLSPKQTFCTFRPDNCAAAKEKGKVFPFRTLTVVDFTWIWEIHILSFWGILWSSCQRRIENIPPKKDLMATRFLWDWYCDLVGPFAVSPFVTFSHFLTYSYVISTLAPHPNLGANAIQKQQNMN